MQSQQRERRRVVLLEADSLQICHTVKIRRHNKHIDKERQYTEVKLHTRSHIYVT